MQIVFEVNADSEAQISAKSIELLKRLPPIVAADYMQDVLFDALDAYNSLRVTLGWEEIDCFPLDAADID